MKCSNMAVVDAETGSALPRSQPAQPGRTPQSFRAGSQLFSLHLSPFCLIQCRDDLITGDGPASACGEQPGSGGLFTVISGIAASVAASCSRPFASSHAIMRSASLCVDATGCCGAAAAESPGLFNAHALLSCQHRGKLFTSLSLRHVRIPITRWFLLRRLPRCS